MITFKDVSKRFPLGNLALDNVSFSIENNEFVLLVGPSGAGKTTIIKLIYRYFLPSSGSITIDDVDISLKNFKAIDTLRRYIGIVFQDFKILFEKTVFENLAIAQKVIGVNESIIKNQVLKTLSSVGLENKKFLFPLQLSAGELQRVAIARAIIGDRNIVLADEPTGNLDPRTSWEIIKIFKKLQSKKTIIIATHNIDIINSLKKRVILLENGKIIKDGKGGYNL